MKRNIRRSLFQAVISTSLLFSLPNFTLGAEPDTGPAGKEPVRNETHLVLSPLLQEKIDRTREFLDEQTPKLSEQLDQLKWLGYIDRRTKSVIDSTIADARQSMTGIEDRERANQLDAGQARGIAYDLGMAGDALAEQAEKLRAESTDSGEKSQERTEIAEILATMSRYLKETARAIVGNIK